MEEKNPRVQRGSYRARTENRSGGSPRRGEKAPRANGNENGQGNKKTRTYKHVQLEHKRPQLSKAGEGGQRAASNRGDQSARRNFASPKKDPNATLQIIPLGGLDASGKNMMVSSIRFRNSGRMDFLSMFMTSRLVSSTIASLLPLFNFSI